MNEIWPLLLFAAMGWEICRGQGGAVLGDLAVCAGEALELMLTVLCAGMLWCGVMAVLEAAGAMKLLERVLGPVLKKLFPHTRAAHPEAYSAICANLSANMMGVGNAASTQGIRAVRQMGEYHPEMALFLILNCSSVQLLPTTLISLRAKYGAPQPQAIIGEVFLTTVLTTVFAWALYRLIFRKENGK